MQSGSWWSTLDGYSRIVVWARCLTATDCWSESCDRRLSEIIWEKRRPFPNREIEAKTSIRIILRKADCWVWATDTSVDVAFWEQTFLFQVLHQGSPLLQEYYVHIGTQTSVATGIILCWKFVQAASCDWLWYSIPCGPVYSCNINKTHFISMAAMRLDEIHGIKYKCKNINAFISVWVRVQKYIKV
jgi:hypothetical protein